MTLFTVANFAGALATAGMGVLGLLAPKTCSRIVGLVALRPTGFSEFRGTFGGLFLALGLTPAVTGEGLCYLVTGLAWLGAAAGRAVSIVADRSAERDNFIALAVELAFAGLLLAGNPVLSRGILA